MGVLAGHELFPDRKIVYVQTPGPVQYVPGPERVVKTEVPGPIRRVPGSTKIITRNVCRGAERLNARELGRVSR